MESWVLTSCLLCTFGFLKEIRPIEPYATQFLVGPQKNFTEGEVNQVIYPAITYCYLSQLILVFLVTDLLRYKTIIVVEGLSSVISTSIFIFCTTLPVAKIMAFFTGTFYATEIAYFTYVYAKVDKKHFQKVTSHTQSAILLGRFLSSTIGQLFISTELLGFEQLNYISAAGGLLSTMWALALPPVQTSIYFNNEGGLALSNGGSPPMGQAPPLRKFTRGYRLLWAHFKAAYTNWTVLKWSIWWALASCGFYQGYFYIQLLWERVAMEEATDQPHTVSIYNGAVCAIYTLIGSVAAFGSGWLRVNWEVMGEMTLGGCAVLQGAAIITAAYANTVLVAYIGFIAFGTFFHAMFTIVNAEVAKHISEDSYGLIFGVNTFFALLFQTVLTLIVAGEGGLALDIRTQFVVYGGYFIVLGCLFATMASISWCKGDYRKQPLWLPRDVQPVHT